eukprot:CAMPEP_0183709620 /NCGR_PEP_ID=MMETSP0737-20130205/5635_1 /TAXON_ID=385413 /ORGANISM="Thalassiosira miniscula, Strain CCMP1093" /LENGTH=213 /DNA_ID=CAMNT_0025937769 /DNA_START=44 /DNA_END=685 /DNA_ORIENTATION=-
MSASAAPIHPSVHFIEFTEASNPINHPDHLHVLWQLHADDQPPQRKPKSSSSTTEPDETAAENDWKGIFEGDLIVFSTLLSGAGEFEAVRFVGPKTTQLTDRGDEDEVLPLLTAGIEYPEFPTLIVHMAEARGASLRELYEVPFDAILQHQPPKLTLLDIMGRDEAAYREFWEDVPVARRRRPPSGNPWKFSLGECVWIRTLTFGSDVEGDEL